MPYDYKENEWYDVDYAAILRHKLHAFPDSTELYHERITYPFYDLNQMDRVDTFPTLPNDKIINSYRYTFFWTPEVYIHTQFSVDGALELIEENINTVNKGILSINDFTSISSGKIDRIAVYDTPDDMHDSFYLAPIIMVPHPLKAMEYLVIDGNHRIDYAKRNGIKEIKYYLLPTNLLFEDKLYLTKYDKLHFLTLLRFLVLF